MKIGFLAAAVCLLLAGCAKRPADLQRAEKFDSECGGRGVAFTYSITTGTALMESGVKSGCYAPLGAWTDDNDANKGGARKLVYDLRENEKQSLLCCKP